MHPCRRFGRGRAIYLAFAPEPECRNQVSSEFKKEVHKKIATASPLDIPPWPL